LFKRFLESSQCSRTQHRTANPWHQQNNAVTEDPI